ncbi:transmembrane protein 205 [Anopheles aquasalis]|uniref:transmembrane protein 205 n=1 Tax=Anopheles aquasalis TaxID=42839 RepID=UPI00215A8D0B|nr:transmembrane protein 205 [Anopheles aquasalis]
MMCCIRRLLPTTTPLAAPMEQVQPKRTKGQCCSLCQCDQNVQPKREGQKVDTQQQQQQQELPQLQEDLLAGATRATRDALRLLQDQAYRFQRSALYSILTNTTQPSHAITALVVSLVVVALWPNLLATSTASRAMEAANVPAPPTLHPTGQLTQLAYIGSFTIHFGAQIWMTFVSGLALYFSLPRHTFGLIQEILFPKYFALGTGLSTISLVSFVELRRNHRPDLAHRNLAHWDPADLLQIGALGLTAALELFVRLYLAPPMLRLMHEKHRIEAVASVGQEVGQFDGAANPKLARSRHYTTTHKKFRQIHMATAILNIVALSCTCVHLLYLAARVNV